MKNIVAIFKKEVYSYFVTPMAHILSAVFLTISGYFFYNIIMVFNEICRRFAGIESMQDRLNMAEMVIRPLIMNMGVILLLIIPVMTMRLYSEEKNSGTIELLFTSPISTFEIAMGKFMASSFVYTILLSVTFIYPLIMKMVGKVENGVLFTAYLGIWFTGLSFIAIGNFTSTLTNNQMISAILSFGLSLMIWMISWAGNLFNGNLAQFFDHLSIVTHLENLSKGILDSGDILYFLSFITIGIFLTIQSLNSMKWRS